MIERIIIQAIIALSAAGSIAAAVAVPASAAVAAPSAHAHTIAIAKVPNSRYHA